MYVDNKFIGVFELPTQVPILAEGKHEISLLAGIKKNGLANKRVIYPFYSSYITEVELIPGAVLKMEPVVEYRDFVTFLWKEDFEDQHISMEKSGSSTTVDTMRITSDPLLVFDYNGTSSKYSGTAFLDTGYQRFEFSTNQLYDIPRAKEVYLEFNFKADEEFVAGIYPITGSVVTGVPIVNFYATTEWKKAYVSLAEDVNSSAYQGVDFRIFFAVTKNNAKTSNVYLDNIKLIHF